MGHSTIPLRSLCPTAWVLTDGAWGTELIARGIPTVRPLDLANLERPEIVELVAASYVDAGSQIISTNTFRSNRIALGPFGQAGLVRALNRRGVEISRSAAAAGVRVFGAIGPSGRPSGPNALQDAFREQAEALAEAGADALLCETFLDPVEAAIAIEAARSTALPVIASFAFVGWLSPEAAARIAIDSGADAVGANCVDPSNVLELVQRLRAASGLPIWIKPNAGLPSIVDGRSDYPWSAGRFAREARGWIEAGADFVGGCCGASPEFIRALRPGGAIRLG